LAVGVGLGMSRGPYIDMSPIKSSSSLRVAMCVTL
jgi:hypothetical protein